MIGKLPLGSGSIVNAHLLAERPKPFGPPPLSAMTKRLNSDQLPGTAHAERLLLSRVDSEALLLEGSFLG